jgi:hypothetical protein
MSITVDTTTNCRLIDARALGTEKLMGEPVKVLLGIMGQARVIGSSDQPLSQYQLSRLLWASLAAGEAALRIEVYVAAIDGLYRFDAEACFLQHVVRGDLRGLLAAAGLSTDAPMSLLYVAELAGPAGQASRQLELAAAIWAGRCLQNVSLMCAAEGLATEMRVVNDASALADAMMLRKSQRLLLAQTVALPAAR